MAVYGNNEIEEIRESLDLDEDPAHPASDERIEQIRQQGVNRSLSQVTHDPTADGTQCPANAVPDGVAVDVQAAAGNDGLLFVGDSAGQQRALGPRESISVQVADTSNIHVRAPTAGDAAVLTWESDTDG